MAVEYNLVTENGDAGSYWAGLGALAKNRYYYDSSFRVYSSIGAWRSAAIARADPKKELVLEIEGKWTDTSSVYTDAFDKFASVKITTRINGLWGSGFHFGVIGGGYKNKTSGSCLRTDGNCIIEGLELESTGKIGMINISPTIIRNCIIKAGTYGIGPYGDLHHIENNLIYDCGGDGISLPSYKTRHYLYNNTIVGCDIGIKVGTSPVYAVNNIAFGCVTSNWDAIPSGGGYWNNNAGAAGDTIWTSTGGISHNITSSDFKNYAGYDFSPSGDTLQHTSSSLLVDVAEKEFASMPLTDIAGNPRPSYKNGAATGYDIGAYEFDWGYGLAPKTVTLEITNIVSGSELAIYKASDNSVIVAPQTVSGTSYSTSYTYTADTLVNIVLRNASGVTKYQPYKTQGNITANGLSVYVSQVEDIIAQ